MKFLTIISFILSFVAIIVSLFKCESMSVDWMSVIVGVLSILVTLLVDRPERENQPGVRLSPS